MSEQCQHRRIGFGSGDYYIMCRDCPKWWVLTDPRKSDVAWPDGAATSNPDDIDVADRDRLAARVKELEEKEKLAAHDKRTDCENNCPWYQASQEALGISLEEREKLAARIWELQEQLCEFVPPASEQKSTP